MTLMMTMMMMIVAIGEVDVVDCNNDDNIDIDDGLVIYLDGQASHVSLTVCQYYSMQTVLRVDVRCVLL